MVKGVTRAISAICICVGLTIMYYAAILLDKLISSGDWKNAIIAFAAIFIGAFFVSLGINL